MAGPGLGPGQGRGPLLILVRYLGLPVPPAGAAWTGFAVDDLPAITMPAPGGATGQTASSPGTEMQQFAQRCAREYSSGTQMPMRNKIPTLLRKVTAFTPKPPDFDGKAHFPL